MAYTSSCSGDGNILTDSGGFQMVSLLKLAVPCRHGRGMKRSFRAFGGPRFGWKR